MYQLCTRTLGIVFLLLLYSRGAKMKQKPINLEMRFLRKVFFFGGVVGRMRSEQ